jgi:pilus assembly protein Flp/PilA
MAVTLPTRIEKGGESMLALYTKLQNRLVEINNEDGATAVEYGIMVALIAAVIIFAVDAVGDKVLAAFETVRDALP